MVTRVFQGPAKTLVHSSGVAPRRLDDDIGRGAWPKHKGKTLAEWEALGRGVYIYVGRAMPKKPPLPNWMPLPVHVAEKLFRLSHSPFGQPRLTVRDNMNTRQQLDIIFKSLKG